MTELSIATGFLWNFIFLNSFHRNNCTINFVRKNPMVILSNVYILFNVVILVASSALTWIVEFFFILNTLIKPSYNNNSIGQFSLCLKFFHLHNRKPNSENFSIYSSKLFHNFHLSESSFNCPVLRAGGLLWRLQKLV